MRRLSPLSAASVGALALAVPVAVQSWFDITDSWWGNTVFVVTQLVGWSLMSSVAATLRRQAGAGTRSRRIGSGAILAGCALQLCFVLGYAASVAVTGKVHDAVFLPFSLGFLALTVGGVTWGHALRRTPGHRQSGLGLLLVAGLGLLAILVGVDPWHDVALVGSYVAWILVGRGTAQSSSSSASARSSLAVGLADFGSGWRPAR